MELTQEYLKSILWLDPKTNIFYWLVEIAPGKKGKQAGYIEKNGYGRISIKGKRYGTHRLIYLYHKGILPDSFIDHKDRNFSNNSIDNLRLSSRSQNGINSEVQKNNTSGYTGVTWNKHAKKWKSQIYKNSKPILLGYFNNKEDAAKAYDLATIELFGEFARTNFPKESYV